MGGGGSASFGWKITNRTFSTKNPCLPLSTLVEAKRKEDDAWRGTGNGENEEEVEMMLSAEASLEVKDERLARSSFVVDKRGLEEGPSIIVRNCAISLSDRGGREGGKTYLKCVTFRKKLRTFEMLPKAGEINNMSIGQATSSKLELL